MNHISKVRVNTFMILFVSLLGLGIVTHEANSEEKTPEVGVKGVPYVTLNNGVKMPQIGFGTWTLQGDTAVQCVKEAIRIGYRSFDTAQSYGNEAEVWQGIVESGIAREEVFITTKIWPTTMRDRTVREALDKSLATFGDGYIDLVLIHWPLNEYIEETWKVMEEYVKNGKVKSIGLSNFNPHHIDDLLKYATIRPVLNQIELHPNLSQSDAVEFSRQKDIQVQCWSPLGAGTMLSNEALVPLAKKHGKSTAQIILRWDIQRGLMTIPRTDNPDYMAENIDIFDFELSPEDMAIINGLNKNERVYPQNDPENFPW